MPADHLDAASAELVVLLAAVRQQVRGSTDASAIDSSIIDKVAPDRLISLARNHGVTALLAGWLRANPEANLSAEYRRRLDDAARLMAQRNLAMVGALLDILRTLGSNGVDAVPYKGPVVAELAYGSSALRAFGDLDLIVQPDQVPRAVACLQKLGYGTPEFEFAFESGAVLPTEGQILLRNAKLQVDVELHWNFFQRFHGYGLDSRRMFDERVEVMVAGHRLRSFSPEDTFLLVCLHHAKHRFERLVWICDVAGLLSREPALDWHLVYERARRLGALRPLLLALRLAYDLLGVGSVDAVLVKQARADRQIGWLYDDVIANLAARDGLLSESLERSRFHLHVRDRTLDRVRYSLRRVFVPTLEDRGTLRLPRPMYALYYLIRPFRIALKRLRR